MVASTLFKDGETVDVIATSRGRGFQGVMKRHHFAGGAATHGSMFHRAPGGIGASSFPSRVIKGKRFPGHMGSDRVTQRNLKIVRIDAENNLVLVRGAIPGAPGGIWSSARRSRRTRCASRRWRSRRARSSSLLHARQELKS